MLEGRLDCDILYLVATTSGTKQKPQNKIIIRTILQHLKGSLSSVNQYYGIVLNLMFSVTGCVTRTFMNYEFLFKFISTQAA